MRVDRRARSVEGLVPSGFGGQERVYWDRPLPADRWARLIQDINRAILANAGGSDADDALLETVISEAVDAFLSRAGHPVTAAMRISGLMRRIGAREAASGRSPEVLDTSLAIARSAAEAYLPRLLAAHPMDPHRTLEMREDFRIFIDQLREHARAGFDRQWSLEEMSPDHAELALRRLLFDEASQADVSRLHLLAHHAGRVLPAQVRPVVAMGAPLLPAVRGADDVLVGARPTEAFVAADLAPDRAFDLAEALAPGGLLVIGPIAPLSDAVRSLGLARRAAALVEAGLIVPEDRVLDCVEVLGQIAVLGDPYLLDVLAAKHLERLGSLSPQRRVDIGELLLEWLESGAAINEVARRLDGNTQTLHARMRAARRLLGDVLDDNAQRVELMIALRRELPRWRRALRNRDRALTASGTGTGPGSYSR